MQALPCYVNGKSWQGAILPSMGQGNGCGSCKAADMHIVAGEWMWQKGKSHASLPVLPYDNWW